MDVKAAFLYGDLDKEIYMEQPEGFQVKGKEDYVCRLQKSLYGFKQAPRQWFGDDDFIILLLYVDDMLIEARFEQILCYERLGASKTNPWHSDFPR
ncbi:putative RNA-directed DNA polymerase [Tanacetum coccineum]